MYAVGISLGASSSYVAVAPVSNASSTTSALDPTSIKVVANTSGHRNTPVVAALTEHELLFGDNALHQYSRQPQKVVPYLFPYAAAAASIADAQHTPEADTESKGGLGEATSDLLRVVEAAARQKYRGHCQLAQAPSGTQYFGFEYTSESNNEPVDSFISAEDLFIRFLNYIKEHSVDSACGLTTTTCSGGPAPTSTKLFLTLTVPRYAFPDASGSNHVAHRGRGVKWLKRAVQSSHLGAVVLNTSVIFSDEAVVAAYDAATLERGVPRLLSTSPHNVLVVDWGAHSLCLSLLCSRGGALVCPPQHQDIPYSCFTKASGSLGKGCFAVGAGSGGDALDVALAERVASQYVTQNRRLFASPSRNFNALLRLNHALTTFGSVQHPATEFLNEVIPSRAMRRLVMLMAEKKVSLNTNPQATSVSVEVEAFYEGMDLMDTQTLSRNKLDNAIRSEWVLVEMFHKALRAFAEKYKDTWTKGFVDTVLLAGGMCQMTSLTKLLTAHIQSSEQNSLFAAAVRVLDSSLIGNGVCADELFSVGGCQQSCRVAESFATKELMMSRVARQGANKLRLGVATQAAETAVSVWDALTKDEDDDGEDDGNNNEKCKGEGITSGPNSGMFIASNLYLYVGDPAALTSAVTQKLPAASLSVLLARSAALPCRVAIPWSPASPDAQTVLYLFTDAYGAPPPDPECDLVEVRPAYSTGLVISAASAVKHDEALGPLCIIFTAQTKLDCVSGRKIQLSVQLVRVPSVGSIDIASLVLTPGIVCSSLDIDLK